MLAQELLISKTKTMFIIKILYNNPQLFVTPHKTKAHQTPCKSKVG